MIAEEHPTLITEIPARNYIQNVVNMMSHNSDNASKESIAPLVDYLNR